MSRAVRIDRASIDREGQLVVHLTTGDEKGVKGDESGRCMVFRDKRAAHEWAQSQVAGTGDELVAAGAILSWLGVAPADARIEDAAGIEAVADKAAVTVARPTPTRRKI